MPNKKSSSSPQLRPVSVGVVKAEVAWAMNALLQRVRGNKSKRSAIELVKDGPLRVSLVGLDEGGKLEEKRSDGAFSIQCLFGRVSITVDGREHLLTTGDLLVVDSGVPHDLTASDPSVLLITISKKDACVL